MKQLRNFCFKISFFVFVLIPIVSCSNYGLGEFEDVVYEPYSLNTILDDFLGTETWREALKNASQRETFKILIDIFKKQLKSIGYPEEGLKLATSEKSIHAGLPTVPIKNTKEVDLYVLILVSKHKLAQKIWNTVIRATPEGQKTLF